MAKTIVSSSHSPAAGAKARARDLLDRRVADVDQCHIGPVEGREVVGIEADSLAADERVRGEQRRHLRVVHQPADFFADEGRCDFVGLVIHQYVLEDAVHAKPTRLPPGFQLAPTRRRAHLVGGRRVHMPPAACRRLLGLLPQFPILRPDIGVYACVQRGVAGGDGVVRLALEDGEVAGFGRDQRDRLDGGRSRADDTDPFAGEGDPLMGPGAGVVPLAREAVQAVEFRPVGGGKTPGGHDAIGGGEPGAVIGRDPPASRRLVESRFGDARPEPDIAAEVEAVRHMLQVAQNLRLCGEALGPAPLLLQRVRELVGILDAVGIAAGAGVAVPVPGAAHPASPLEDADGETHIAQPMEHVEPGEPCADHDRVDIRRVRVMPTVLGVLSCGRCGHGRFRFACLGSLARTSHRGHAASSMSAAAPTMPASLPSAALTTRTAPVGASTARAMARSAASR